MATVEVTEGGVEMEEWDDSGQCRVCAGSGLIISTVCAEIDGLQRMFFDPYICPKCGGSGILGATIEDESMHAYTFLFQNPFHEDPHGRF